jgi:hypothetical protein
VGDLSKGISIPSNHQSLIADRRIEQRRTMRGVR